AIRAGLRSYAKGEYDKALDSFAAAREQYDSRDAAKAAIAAFNQGCAMHRKRDVSQARECYLKAGLARDQQPAAGANRTRATRAGKAPARRGGEHPEGAPPDHPKKILEDLRAAAASFPHSLELTSDHARARRDIELVRQWIKYYADR